MVFEPDSSLNATVLSPIASPCASAQGAASGAPATTPPVPVSSSEQNELGKQVEDLKLLVVGLMKDVHRLSTSATATVSAPPPAEGAAGGAPQQSAQQGEAASSAQPQVTTTTGAVPTLVLPLKPRQQTPQGDDPDSSDSSSSSSSSGSPAPSRPACRMCGSKAHDEADCPFLTVNRSPGPPGGGGDGGGSPDGDPEGNPPPATAFRRGGQLKEQNACRARRRSHPHQVACGPHLPCSTGKRGPGTRFCKPSANGDWQSAALVGTRLREAG